MAPSSIEVVKPVVAQAPQPAVSEPSKIEKISSEPVVLAKYEQETGVPTDETPKKAEEEAAYSEIAQEIREAFSPKKVSFSGSASKIQFTVFDEDTGEVIRSFPEKGKGGILAKRA